MAFWASLVCTPRTSFVRAHRLQLRTVVNISPMSVYSTQSTLQPPWLKALLDDQSPPSRLYAWTPENVGKDAQYRSSSKDDLDRRIFILGVGNLGRLFASYLARRPDPPPITLVVHRKELLSQWVESPGIEVTRLGVLDQNKNFDIEWWTETAPEHGTVREVADGRKLRNLIIGTKASIAIPETDRLRRYLDGGSSLAYVQNGVHKLWPPNGPEYMSQRYPNGDGPNILACVTSHGVTSQGPFKSLHASPADATIGPVLLNTKQFSSNAPSVAYLTQTVATTPLLDAKSVSRAEVWAVQLQKLVINSSINPLTAILRCKNEVLFKDPNGIIAQVMDRLLAESSSILQALINHPMSAEILTSSSQPGGQDLDSVRDQLTARFSQPQLREMLHRIGQIVGENISSMLQDVRAGKPTEVRDFNGWLVDTASFLQQDRPGLKLDASCHQALTDLVEAGTVMTETELGKHFLSS